MSILTAERTARKRHRCERCRRWIEPGTRHEVSALTPNSDLGNRGWWHARRHLTEQECFGTEDK